MSVELANSSHFLKLIHKEDFNSLKPGFRYPRLDRGNFSLEVQTTAIQPITFLSKFVTKESSSFFVEGRMEEGAIYLKGDHATETGEHFVHIKFGNHTVHRFRFAVDQSGGGRIPVRYMDKRGALIESRFLNAGFNDFTVPFESSQDTRIDEVIISMGVVGHYGPTLDTFEIFQWLPYGSDLTAPGGSAESEPQPPSQWH